LLGCRKRRHRCRKEDIDAGRKKDMDAGRKKDMDAGRKTDIWMQEGKTDKP
jgi:hypothetical protein